MNYAVVENGLVTNLIWLNPSNADEFPNAVHLGDRPVGIGDSYVDGHFYRDGAEVLTTAEELALAEAALLEIEEAMGIE